MYQIEMVSLDDLVPANHSYRQFLRVWTFKSVENHLKPLENDNYHKDYGLFRLFKCLLLQFMENLSDQELERYLQENTTAKWFCEFGLTEITPGYSVFNKLRTRIGISLLSKIFSELRDQLKQQGIRSEVLNFTEVSHVIAKISLWQDRDKAIKEKKERYAKHAQYKRLNVGNIGNVRNVGDT